MPLNKTESFLQTAENYAIEQKNKMQGKRMRPKNKTDKFLTAIKKYAEEQKSAMQGEVKQLKTERLKDAEERAKHDSEELIREKLEASRARETALLAAKTQEGQKKLFIERSRMVDEIFKDAESKLTAFTATDAYQAKLRESVAAVAQMFGENDCVLYICERDIDAVQKLTALFKGDVRVEADKTIRIGGVKGYCAAMRMIADETLDSKLMLQREWFVENAALSVL